MMLILIAGPYRSGTNNDPKLIEGNMSRLEAVALPIFRKGHIPMIGEWVANPLIALAEVNHNRTRTQTPNLRNVIAQQLVRHRVDAAALLTSPQVMPAMVPAPLLDDVHAYRCIKTICGGKQADQARAPIIFGQNSVHDMKYRPR